MLWSEIQNLWDPWKELDRVNSTFRNAFSDDRHEFPPVNVWLSSDEAVVTTEIAGVDASDIEISVSGSTLSLRGQRKTNDLRDDRSCHRKERWNGKFSKTIEVPFSIEPAKVSAQCRKGVLSVTLPKAEAEKPRKIEIRSE